MIGYWEYDPVIYPRKLWVYTGYRLSEVCDVFEDLVPEKDYMGITYEESVRKQDGEIGILVAFDTICHMSIENIAHEASHVVDVVETSLGIDHGGESTAYLLGWVAKCIDMAKNGTGKYIKIGI